MTTLMVTGSRTAYNQNIRNAVFEELEALHRENIVTKLLSGNAEGVDRIAEEWAKSNDIPVQRHLPDWKQYGRGGGVVRNNEMIALSTFVVVFWDGSSKGTRHAIDVATRKNKLKKIILLESRRV